MLNAGQAGFVNAPVSKTIIASVVLATVFGSIIESQSRLTLRLPLIIQSKQIWRLLTHNFVFTTPGELLFGIVLLYFFRQFERQLGSSRFAAFALITSTIYTAVLVLAQLSHDALVPASGPYSLIFSSVVHFFLETPKIYHFQLFGAVDLSDKTFAYLLAIQLIFSSPPRSLISCAAAIFAGIVYRIPFLREHADLPDGVIAACSTYVLPLLGTLPRASRRSHARGQPPPTDGANTQEADLNAFRPPSPPAVSRDHVSTLIAMGFSSDEARAALQRTHDDVQAATELLLQATDNT